MAEEFNSAYVINLRGDARGGRSLGNSEGEGVFGNATRSSVAITILVKNSEATHDGCLIQYREIGDGLKRQEKLESLSETKSIHGFSDWQKVKPDKHHDWIQQRSEKFTEFYPLGTTESKAGKTDNAIFHLYSLGYSTNRDAHVYNFSRDACAENAQLMTREYLAAVRALEENPELSVAEVVHQYSTNIKWDDTLKNKLKQKKKTEFKDGYVRKVAYRPFVATNCYADYTFITRKGQMDKIFPDNARGNRVICVPSKGSKNPFSPLMTDMVPDLHFNEFSQCFPRWRYPQPVNAHQITTGDEPDRIDNISDTALRCFRDHYRNNSITKDNIFDYVYGILHAPSYREQFANDLSKMIPRIPFAPDFYAFAEAGKALTALHLGYETCDQYPHLKVEPRNNDLFWEEKPEYFLLGPRAMRFVDRSTKDTLIISEHIQLSDIPREAHGYVVNDKTPLEWFINRYKITQPEKNRGILNDPNCWFEKPRDLVTAINRIIYVSIESTKIIGNLPSKLTDD